MSTKEEREAMRAKAAQDWQEAFEAEQKEIAEIEHAQRRMDQWNGLHGSDGRSIFR